TKKNSTEIPKDYQSERLEAANQFNKVSNPETIDEDSFGLVAKTQWKVYHPTAEQELQVHKSLIKTLTTYSPFIKGPLTSKTCNIRILNIRDIKPHIAIRLILHGRKCTSNSASFRIIGHWNSVMLEPKTLLYQVSTNYLK
ncbi:44646_t:CDS:2, partial [Gigaspora margarita]